MNPYMQIAGTGIGGSRYQAVPQNANYRAVPRQQPLPQAQANGMGMSRQSDFQGQLIAQPIQIGRAVYDPRRLPQYRLDTFQDTSGVSPGVMPAMNPVQAARMAEEERMKAGAAQGPRNSALAGYLMGQ